MVDIQRYWKLDNSTFQAVEMDETIDLVTSFAKFAGEKGAFLHQDVGGSRIRLSAYPDNKGHFIQTLYSENKLKLERYDGKIQYVEPYSETHSIEPPTKGSNIIELDLITADPYKYSGVEERQSGTVNLSSETTTLNLYTDSDFETPLNFKIDAYTCSETSKPFSETDKSYALESNIYYRGNINNNLTVHRLTQIPPGNFFDSEGMILPPFQNQSGFIWTEVDAGTKLNQFSNYLENTVNPVQSDSGKWYSVNFFKISYPFDLINNTEVINLQVLSRFCSRSWSWPICSFPVWQVFIRNLSDWSDISGETHEEIYCRKSIGVNNIINDRIHFIVGATTRLSTSIIYRLHQINFAIEKENIISVLQLPDSDIHSPAFATISGYGNFSGDMDITTYSATVTDKDTRVIHTGDILDSITISGVNWSGEHNITCPIDTSSTIGIRLNPNLSGGNPLINIFNTSASGDGLIFYSRSLDGVETINISGNYESIIKNVTYLTPTKDIEIKNQLDLNTELKFSGMLFGTLYHYNDSDYFKFNPMSNLSYSYIRKNSQVGFSNDQINIDAGGEIVYGIYPLMPFSSVPNGNWTGTGNLSAFIASNDTSDSDCWYEFDLHNSPFKFPIYSNSLNLLGENHFLLKLKSATATKIYDMNIKGPVSFAGKDFVQLHPNTTSIILIDGKNLNESVVFEYDIDKTYL